VIDMEQFGRYRLEELVGRGGMGEVFRAYDTEHERVVALKRLPAHLAADPEFRARFRKEAAIASRLTEPHIVPIHDFGEIDGRLYLDMRLVSGRDLAAVLAQDGPLAPERAVSVVAQVASALDAAHAGGLLHRDVKPANVLLAGDFAYLADFGVARAIDGSRDSALTATGATVGTLGYMAPERFLGDRVDHRADVYALACVLVELLTGRPPFAGASGPALMHAHMASDAPSPSRAVAGIPAALDEVVARGMAKRPDNRYATAGAFAAAAAAALAVPVPAPRQAPETRLVGAAAPGWPADPWPPSAHVSGPQPYGPPAPGYGPSAFGPSAFGAPAHGAPAHGAPSAGAHGAAAFAPPPAPRRRPLVAAVAAAVAVALAVAAAVVLWPRGEVVTEPRPPEVVVAGPTGAPPTGTPQTGPTVPPTSQPADTLVTRLTGQGYDPASCQDAQRTDGAVEQIQCATTDAGAPVVVFQQFADPTSYDGSLATVQGQTSGTAAGDCSTGGDFSGTFAGYDIVCGTAVLDDGTAVYVIGWGEPSSLLQGFVAGEDPAAVWNWWLVNTPF
jgi:hypothetical protein